MNSFAKGLLTVGLFVICAVFLATESPAAQRFCTQDGPITALIVGCPPCLSFDPDLIAQFHQGEQNQQFFDCDTGLPVPASIIAAEHILRSCQRGDPGTPPESTPETCFEPGSDVLPDTTLRVAVEIAGVPVLIEATGTTNVERKGDAPDPGPATLEMDNTILTGQTDLGQPVTVRIGQSFGLPATLGTVTRVPSPGFPDRVAVAFAINAEITLEDPFPPAGTDTFPTSIVFVDEDELGQPVLLSAQGPTIVERSDPAPDPQSGRNVIETEIVSMELVGSSPLGPVSVRAGSKFGLPASTGRTLGASTARDFPADSFFDVFFEIEIGGACLRNTQPQLVSAVLTEIPPLNPPEFSFSSILEGIDLEDCDNDEPAAIGPGPESHLPALVASIMAFHCTPQMAGLPPNTIDCCRSAVNTFNNGGCCPPGPPPPIPIDPSICDELFGCPPDPDPRTQGYWHRQCLGAGFITPGRTGRGGGPQEPLEPNFVDLELAVSGRLAANLGDPDAACAGGMVAEPPSDPCERAIKQYTALLFNIESGRLGVSCEIDVSALGCSATTIGDLVDELTTLINDGQDLPDASLCHRANDCAAAANEFGVE